MDFLVLGAGVIGVTTAWYLRAQGHDVRVVERQPGPALETSFANAGQVAAHISEPWANPQTPRMLPKWLLADDAPLVWHPRASLTQWRWLAQFLRECSAQRYGRNLVHLANIGLYSRTALKELRRELGLSYDQREGGILLFHRDPAQFERAAAAAKRLAARGFEREVKTRDECLAIEPALAPIRDHIVGGIYSAHDETGDAQQFSNALARICAERGVAFDYGTKIVRIAAEGDRVTGVEVERAGGGRDVLRAGACVVALGCATPAMLKPLGIGGIAIQPVKGYSVTVPIADEKRAFGIGLHDVSKKMAFARLGMRLRGTSTAEIGAFDTTVNERRCKALVDHIDWMTPGAGRAQEATYWAGLRPMTPSNIPYVGRTRIGNLYINAGHGTVGWTQSCGSAKALAEIVGGRRPALDFPFAGME
ncbi:MAG: D-amino acid dehydrogenase [Burkholderiales bacterium]|nr:D-amino acid dehydrogenase [Burkholderiales bacterium]